MVAVPPPVPAKPPELPRMAKSPSGKVKSEPPSQPNRTSEGVVAEGDEREARKQAKREAALKVLAELATADGSAQTGK
jgi:hypothetical protein